MGIMVSGLSNVLCRTLELLNCQERVTMHARPSLFGLPDVMKHYQIIQTRYFIEVGPKKLLFFHHAWLYHNDKYCGQ